MGEIPNKTLDRIIRMCGAERVSKSAAEELGTHLENISRNISFKAIELAEHAGRKTIRAEDVKLALDNKKS